MVTKKIRSLLKKAHPNAVKKVKKHLRFRFAKIALLALSIVLAYFIFQQSSVSYFIKNFDEVNNYLGSFIAGVFLAFGFTTPFALGFLITSQPKIIFLSALLGSLGSLISNFLIFKLIRTSFMDEVKELKKTKTAKKIEALVKKNIRSKIKHYLLYLFAGILIATPLPDEVGISMLAGLTTIKTGKLVMISFILHYIEILMILALSS